jgi:NifB/MoaA-like Fe-S oxidoreductase
VGANSAFRAIARNGLDEIRQALESERSQAQVITDAIDHPAIWFAVRVEVARNVRVVSIHVPDYAASDEIHFAL